MTPEQFGTLEAIRAELQAVKEKIEAFSAEQGITDFTKDDALAAADSVQAALDSLVDLDATG